MKMNVRNPETDYDLHKDRLIGMLYFEHDFDIREEDEQDMEVEDKTHSLLR